MQLEHVVDVVLNYLLPAPENPAVIIGLGAHVQVHGALVVRAGLPGFDGVGNDSSFLPSSEDGIRFVIGAVAVDSDVDVLEVLVWVVERWSGSQVAFRDDFAW